MSLSSWALVMAHHRERENVARRLRLSRDGELRHARAAARLRPARRPGRQLRLRRDARRAPLRDRSAALVLVLALVGAGSKAGLVPLHVWLPLAHPAAPSHVSALMSGVMTKVAVYGFVRIVFDLLGAAGLVVEHGGACARRHHRGAGRALCADAAATSSGCSPTARSRTSASSSSGSAWRSPSRRNGMATRGGAGADRGAVPRLQPFAVQEPAVLRRRRRAARDRRARHGAARRPDPPHAADRLRVPGRLRRDLGAAAAQRLRLRVADLPGDPAQPATAALGAEVPGAGGRRAARAVGGARRRLLRQGLRRHVPRPPAHAGAAERAQETDRFSLAAMFALAALCLVAGILPGLVIDALAPVVQGLVGARMPVQTGVAWLSIVPIAESRSSYNGLLVFVFIALSGIARGLRDPPPRLRPAAPRAGLGLRLSRCRARRRSTPPAASPSRSAASSARVVFRAREQVDMPPPGDMRPARLTRRVARPRLGHALRADRRRRRRSPPSGSTTCSS